MTFALSLAEKGEGIEDAALSEKFRNDNPNGFYLYRHLNMFNLAVVRGEDFGVTPQMLLGSMFGPDNQIPPSDLTAIKTPVFILGGSEDRLVTPETTTAIAGFFHAAELHVFDGSGHSPYFEMPTPSIGWLAIGWPNNDEEKVMTKVYMIANVTIEDAETYLKYEKGFFPA